MTSGRNRAGSVSSCSRKMPSRVILPSAWRSAEHDTAIATGQLAPWRGRRTIRTSWQKYLPPNWAPIPVCWASAQHLAPRARRRGTRGRAASPSSAACRGSASMASFAVSTANSADVPPIDDGQVVRRAGRRAERLHLLEDPRQQRRLVEQRLGLLVQVALVGAAAALGDEQELVRVAVDGRDLDLGGQVGAGVALVVHRDRRHLAVAQVAT